MEACVAQWNNLEDSDIKFEVAENETNRTRVFRDEWSTVTFEDFRPGDGAAARANRPEKALNNSQVVVSDIRFNTLYAWTTSATYPSSWLAAKPKDFRDVMTHELGHSAGLGHSDDKHKNNTMYYESKRDETKRRTLEWGDKAGGVYMTTAPGIGKNGELGFSQDWSAFTGSGQPITLHKNITVVEKNTLTLEQGLFIDMGENENTISAGLGTINGTATPVVNTPGPPDAPRNLKTTSGFGQIGLDWDAPILNGGLAITRYEYRYQVSGGTWSSWSSVGLATDATQTGLADNTTYNFAVRAVNKHGFGTAASRSATTPEANTPSAPRNLTATPGTSQVALSWSAPASDGGSAITRYEYRWREANGTWSVWLSTGSATSTTKTGLTSNTTYEFEVRARNVHGAGSAASASATTLEEEEDTTPDQPGSVSLTTTTPVVGSPVTATLTDPDGGISGASWQWQTSSTENVIEVEGVVDSTYPELSSYTPTRQDLGRRLQAKVTYNDQYRTGRAAESVLTGAISAGTSTASFSASVVPNPFNPQTTVRFELPTAGPVSLVVYNLAGQPVRTLLTMDILPAGSHAVVWDARDGQGRLVASGLYLLRWTWQGQDSVQKITLLR